MPVSIKYKLYVVTLIGFHDKYGRLDTEMPKVSGFIQKDFLKFNLSLHCDLKRSGTNEFVSVNSDINTVAIVFGAVKKNKGNFSYLKWLCNTISSEYKVKLITGWEYNQSQLTILKNELLCSRNVEIHAFGDNDTDNCLTGCVRFKKVFFLSAGTCMRSNSIAYSLKDNNKVFYLHDYSRRPNLFSQFFDYHIDIFKEQYDMCKAYCDNEKHYNVPLSMLPPERDKSFIITQNVVSNFITKFSKIFFIASPLRKLSPLDESCVNDFISISRGNDFGCVVFTDQVQHLKEYVAKKGCEPNFLILNVQSLANVVGLVDVFLMSTPFPGGGVEIEVCLLGIPIIGRADVVKILFESYSDSLTYSSCDDLLRIVQKDKEFICSEFIKYKDLIVNDKYSRELISDIIRNE